MGIGALEISQMMSLFLQIFLFIHICLMIFALKMNTFAVERGRKMQDFIAGELNRVNQ